MFDDLNKKTKVEDIFSGTETTVKPDVSGPAAPAAPTPPPPFAPVAAGVGEGRREKVKKILIFAILIIGVVFIIFGIFWVLKKIDSSLNKEGNISRQEEAAPAVTGQNQPPAVPAPAPVPEGASTAGETPSPGASMFFPPSVIEPPVTGPIDTDQDGLTDEEELALGTDPNNIDTDGDGLFDREEVMVYKTDPLNPDTDGDGYLDGEEVKNGYNPNGPGKLYEIQ